MYVYECVIVLELEFISYKFSLKIRMQRIVVLMIVVFVC